MGPKQLEAGHTSSGDKESNVFCNMSAFEQLLSIHLHVHQLGTIID